MNIRYHYRFVLYYFIIIIILLLGATIFAVEKNKSYTIDKINKELILVNNDIARMYEKGIFLDNISFPNDVRIGIFDTSFNQLYKNYDKDLESNKISIPNRNNKENDTLDKPNSFFVPQIGDYLYYIKNYGDFYVRTSKLYTQISVNSINNSNEINYLMIGLALLLITSLIFISNKITMPLKAFTQFIDALNSDKKDFSKVIFPNNEYGDIGRKIIATFEQYDKTKEYKQQMSHNIAHELKTPVTGIRAYLETIIHDEEMKPEQMRNFATKALNQTIRLSKLITDVSTINKIDEGIGEFNIEDVNITDCINEIRDELAPKLKANKSTLKLYFSSTLSIRGNFSLIYSLFKNLIDNTLEYGGMGTEISINAGIIQIAGVNSYKIIFTYSDNGKGVATEELDRLFERFYRTEKGRTRKTGGSGLGLSIVKNTIILHKGDIVAEHRVGGGLTFKFSLTSLS